MLGKRFVRSHLSRVVTGRRELRDAILWEVHPGDRLAYVRIQGSSENVVAYYPRHWTTVPEYMKVGASVRIAHVGGIDRVEITGPGLLLPTAVSGSSLPPIATGADGVLTGLDLYPTSPESMTVLIQPGTYRISGTIYVAGDLVMGGGLPMGSGAFLGEPAGFITFDAASPSYYRYDAVVVGADGVFDYLKGTEASTNPALPSVPGGHVLVGDYVLIYPGMTEVTSADVGRRWTTPMPSELRMTIGDDDLAWGQMTTGVSLSVRDQYGRAYSLPAPGFYFLLSIVIGNGTITSAEEGSSTTQIGGHGQSGYTFTYTRDGNDPGDWSPLLQGETEYQGTLVAIGRIVLRNAGGVEMPVT